MKQFPVEIFLIIREYIENHNDYRMFMNCNKEIFQSIKYQTVFFMFLIRLEAFEVKYIHEYLKQFQTLILRVKDKSKQIGLFLYQPTFDILMLSAPMFKEIHYLKIFFLKVTKNINFNIFDNIYHVQLYGLSGIATIDSGFKDVRILNISGSPGLSTVDLRHARLDQFQFSFCSDISVLHGINNVRRLVFGSFPSIPVGCELMPNVRYESISLCETVPYLDMLLRCDLSHLHSLSLHEFHVLERAHLLRFKDISHLSLSTSRYAARDNYLTLPIFYGRSLELSRFNLQYLSSPEVVPNIKRIKLEYCINLDPQLSFLTNVRSVKLSSMDYITNIATMPNCIKLTLFHLTSLHSIAMQPRLLSLKLDCCSNLTDYEIDGQLFKQVAVYSCPKFAHLYKFRNAREFSFDIIHEVKPTNYSVVGYNRSDRTVRITFHGTYTLLVSLNGFDLANLRFFVLPVSGEVSELGHFHNNLTVKVKITSETFRNQDSKISYLRNIQVLEFTEMNSLQSLHHLENIDRIMLCAFPADFQFDGLKGCRVVYSRGNKRLEEQAELYGRGERDVSLFDSSYLEMFGSIEEFYIVHEYWEGLNWQNLPEYGITRLW